MACMPQPWNWLEDRRSKNDKVSREMWKVIETKAEEVRLAEVKRRRKRRKGKEMRGKRMEKGGGAKEKIQEREDDRDEKTGKRVGNLRQREESSKVRSRDKEIGTRILL